jgi:hypothetical protein
VPASADPGDETRSHVDAGGNREPVRGLDRSAPREDGIDTPFALEFLLIHLGTADGWQCNRSS